MVLDSIVFKFECITREPRHTLMKAESWWAVEIKQTQTAGETIYYYCFAILIQQPHWLSIIYKHTHISMRPEEAS